MKVPIGQCKQCGSPLDSGSREGFCLPCLFKVLAAHDEEVATEPASSQDEPFLRCLGDYCLLEELGRGGMGVVFKARQCSLNRIVAVKMLAPGVEPSPEFVERLHSEATSAACLHHPRIVAVHEMGVCDKQHYFAMDFIDGQSLAELAGSRPLPARQAARYVRQISEAVHYAHERGILHRDLKPSNILVDAEDEPHVTDFGLARRLESSAQMTLTGQVLGSPPYMAPEQVQGSGGKLTRATDVYALGAMLYHLLTGRPPFLASEVAQMLHLVLTREPVSPRVINPSVPRDLETICLKCLEKAPARRYATAEKLAEELDRFLTSKPLIARPPGVLDRLLKAFRRNKLAFIAGALVFTSLIVGVVVSSWQAGVATQARNVALQAQAEKEQEARNAQEQRRLAERRLYAADMKLAQQALIDHNLGAAVSYLQRHIPVPASGDIDLRGFEWRYLWQQTRGQELRSFTAQSPAISGLAFSPDGRWLAAAEAGGTEIIDLSSWRVHLALADTNIQLSVQFSPDSQTLLTTGINDARLWDTHTWQLKTLLNGVSGLAAFFPDGRTLIRGSAAGLQIWDTKPLRPLHTLPQQHLRQQWQNDASANLSFSSDGRWMAALVEDELPEGRIWPKLRIWPTAALRESGPAALAREIALPELAVVMALTLSADGRHVAVANTVGYITILDTSTGALVAHCRETPVRAYRIRFAPDSTLIAGLSDQTIAAWQPQGTNLVKTGWFRGHLAEVGTITPSYDWQFVATADFIGVLKLWRTSDLTTRGSSEGQTTIPGLFHNLHFLSDNQTLVASTRTNVVFWDTAAGRPLRTIPEVPWQAAARVSPNERWIAVARTNGMVELFERATATSIATLLGHTQEVRRILFSPDSRQMLTATVFQRGAEGEHFEPDSAVRLWQVPSGRLLVETNLSAPIAAIALAPDGESFAVQLYGRSVEVRQTKDFTLVFQMTVPYDSRTQLTYSPDGKLLVFAGGGRSNEIGVFDLGTKRFRFSLRGHILNLNGMAFSPDGATLATAAGDHTVRLWSIETGQEMLVLTLPSGVNQVAFSPDGRILAASRYWLDQGQTRAEVRLFHAPSLEETTAARTE